MQTPAANFYEFGGFQLDPTKRILRRRDGTVVPLTPRVFDTLLYMVEHHDGVLDKERIMEAVWPDSIVEENNLAQAIWKLRQLFGEKPGSHDYIVTVPGRGYRFVAEVIKRSAQTTDEVTSRAAPDPIEGATTSELPSSREAPVLQHRRATNVFWRWLVAAAAAILILAAVLFFLRNRTSSSFTAAKPSSGDAPARQSVAAEIPDKSIAVLPFENRSRDPDNIYFTDGVQDEILTDLARIADLKVISRTSVMQYKSDLKRNLRQIAQELGVAHVLEGSVQRAANRVRVNAQLIDARTDAHLWAETYDRDLADVFAIQSEIANTIADQLQAKLSPVERNAIDRPPTADVPAFDLYSRAKTLLETRFFSDAKGNLLQATELLNQTLERDPSFFDAYCQLAHAHDVVYFSGYDHTPARLALAEAAVESAFRLRPDAGEAHLARAWNLYYGYLDYEGALSELEVARQTLPNHSGAFLLKGAIARRRGRWEDSIRNFERAVDLDPRNIFTLQQSAVNYVFLRRYEDEKTVLDRVLAIAPQDVVTQSERALVDFNSHADTRSIHQLIDSVQASRPDDLPKIANPWLLCALGDREAGAAREALNAFGENQPSLSNDNVFLTRRFVEGLVARMTGNEDKARLAFTVARAEQEKIVQAQPNYGPALCVLGLIDAGLGRKEEALREGRRAIELLPIEKDATNGAAMIKYLAIIAAWLGDNDLACQELAGAVRYPGSLNYGYLMLLPFWDPLRGDPRFEKIVASLAPPEKVGSVEGAKH